MFKGTDKRRQSTQDTEAAKGRHSHSGPLASPLSSFHYRRQKSSGGDIGLGRGARDVNDWPIGPRSTTL